MLKAKLDALAAGVFLTRDLVSEPGNILHPDEYAKRIAKLRKIGIKVTVYGAGELVPAFEIFDAVSNGVAELGHGSAYYWKGKNDTFQFFSTVPFGMTSSEMNAWLYKGGGMEFWQKE